MNIRHDADLDDEDEPLDAEDEKMGSAAAASEVAESLEERVGVVLDELDEVSRRRDGEVELYSVGSRVFAALGADLLEVALGGEVAKAALATPDTRPSPRGTGWVAFTPAATDRLALDRAEAWVRLAHRRASGR